MINYTDVWSIHKNTIPPIPGFSLILSVPSPSLNYIQANKTYFPGIHLHKSHISTMFVILPFGLYSTFIYGTI